MEFPRIWSLYGEDHLPYRLLLTARMIDRETAKQLQNQFGLTLAEWRLLAIASALGPCSASEIGAAGEIDRAEISRAFRSLEAADILQREPDPAHKKRLIITPTSKGEALNKEILLQRRAFFQVVLGGLKRDERADMDRYLEQMVTAIKSDDGDL